MSQVHAETCIRAMSAGANHSERTASLNSDGTLKWFIPPFVIPALILLLVAARLIWLS